MNHSNKDGTSLAESEEGRLRIKENTLSIRHVPDSERGLRVSHGWASVWPTEMGAAIHPR